MAIHFHNPNRGLDPQDPAYDHDWNEEEELDAYLDAMDLKEERERGN